MALKTAALRVFAAISYRAGITGMLSRVGGKYALARTTSLPKILERRKKSAFQILIYHRVNPDRAGFSIGVISPETFERQLRYLTRYYSVWPLARVVAALRNRDPLPHNCMAVTFDDGYLDNYQFAFPILKKHGIPAAIFLATGFMDNDRLLWFDRVLQIFQRTRKTSLQLEGLPGELRWSGVEERRRAAFVLLEHLKTLPENDKLAAMDRLGEELDCRPEEAGPRLMLDWDQVREMARSGLSFGAHTASHPILSRIPLERAEEEILQSKRDVQNALQQEATLFAYPNGRPADFNPQVIALVRKAGFQAAVTTVFKNNSADEDLFQLNRINPWEEHLPSFALKMAYYKLAL